MGSFAYTCSVSNLPIHCGDPVRFGILCGSPYEENDNTSSGWWPRIWPFKAKYNDYGTIEDYDPKDIGIQLLQEGLKVDLVERGTGDNSVHDVPTAKEMPFEELLNALREGRLQVAREAPMWAWRDDAVKAYEEQQASFRKHFPEDYEIKGEAGNLEEDSHGR